MEEFSVPKDGTYKVPDTVPILRSSVNLYSFEVLIIDAVTQNKSLFWDCMHLNNAVANTHRFRWV